MFIALFVVVNTLGAVGRVPLVYLGFGEFVFELVLEGKGEKRLALCGLCQ